MGQKNKISVTITSTPLTSPPCISVHMIPIFFLATSSVKNNLKINTPQCFIPAAVNTINCNKMNQKSIVEEVVRTFFVRNHVVLVFIGFSGARGPSTWTT